MIIVNGGIPDPVQKALRVRKANWNKKMVTPFIDNLIHLKMLINGKPSKFHKERNSIINPLPADPATILGLLAEDFKNIVNEGNAIISDQLNYSQTRRKKGPKPETPAKAPNPNQLNLPGITSSILEVNRINVQASNYLTRFLSTLKGPRFGESPEAIKRRYRGSLLKQAHEIYKLCSDFQADIVKFDVSKLFSKDDEEGLYEATKTLIDIESKFSFMLNGINLFNKDMLRITNTGQESPSDGMQGQLVINAADDIVQEWNQVSSSILKINPEFRQSMLMLVREYANISEDDVNLKTVIAGRIFMTYKKILAELNSSSGTNAKSLSEFLFMPKTEKNAAEFYSLEIMASKNLEKWVGKGLRSMFSKKTSANRLSAYKSAIDMRKGLDHLMNVLEKDFDLQTLLDIAEKEINDPLFRIGEAIDSMLDDVRLNVENISYKDPKKEEKKNKFLKLIDRRKMTQMTRRLVPSNYGLLTQRLNRPMRQQSLEPAKTEPPIKPPKSNTPEPKL